MAIDALEAGIVGLDPTLTTFYVDALDFDVSARLDYPQGRVDRLCRGPARLKIFYPEPPARPRGAAWYDESGFRYAALYLESAAEVRRTVDAVVTNGGSVVAEPTDYDEKTIALVADPEHNVLELICDG